MTSVIRLSPQGSSAPLGTRSKLVSCLLFSSLTIAFGVASSQDTSGTYYPDAYQAKILLNYLSSSTLIHTRGFWYDITTWAARTHNCDHRPESVACMACCMNLPAFAWEMGVAPLGVGNDLWFGPSRGATCGMCLQVFMPKGLSDCSNPDTNPECAGTGTMPYDNNVAQPWAYGAKIHYDQDLKMNYFIGMVIEWFDRNQSLSSAITYPAQGRNIDDFGSWPVQWRAVACPVSHYTMDFQFQNLSATHPAELTEQTGWASSAPSVGNLPLGVSNSLCNNEFSGPCGALQTSAAPLKHVKFMVSGSRVPPTAVSVKLQGQWRQLCRSGDNYWQICEWFSSDQDFPEATDPSVPVDVRIWCSSGPDYLEQTGVVPNQCMCAYQDPDCKPCRAKIQC